MNKKTALIFVILTGLLSSCSLIPQLQQAREAYLETRVVELLAELPTAEVTLEPVEAEPTASEEAVAKMPEATEEPTAEVTEAPTAEAKQVEEPTLAPTSTSKDPAVYLGDPDWKDEMTKVGNWPTSTDEYLSATYENETLKMVALSETNGWRLASTNALKDAYIEATFKVMKCDGTDGYGLIFRVPDKTNANRGYLFGVTCDGRYGLRTFDGTKGEYGQMLWLKYHTASDLVKKGKEQTHRLGVMTVGNTLAMFIDGVKVAEISDQVYTEGFFGLYINRDKTENLTVFVDDVAYWLDPTLP